MVRNKKMQLDFKCMKVHDKKEKKIIKIDDMLIVIGIYFFYN